MKEALEGLRRMANSAPGKIMLQEMAPLVKPIIEDVQARALRKTGEMADSYGIAERQSVVEGCEMVVGPRISKRYRHGFLWRLWELGTKYRAAYPVIRPVWDGRIKELGEKYMARLNARITKAAKAAGG